MGMVVYVIHIDEIRLMDKINEIFGIFDVACNLMRDKDLSVGALDAAKAIYDDVTKLNDILEQALRYRIITKEEYERFKNELDKAMSKVLKTYRNELYGIVEKIREAILKGISKPR